MMGKTTATMEPCAGRRCEWAKDCALYVEGAVRTHGQMDSDEGWVCDEWTPRHEPVAETEEEQGELW